MRIVLYDKSIYGFDLRIKNGVTQTVSVKSPYIYAEDNWADDMELAKQSLSSLKNSTTKMTKTLS